MGGKTYLTKRKDNQMADFKLTLEEVVYDYLREKLIELGEDDFVDDAETRYQEYLEDFGDE